MFSQVLDVKFSDYNHRDEQITGNCLCLKTAVSTFAAYQILQLRST